MQNIYEKCVKALKKNDIEAKMVENSNVLNKVQTIIDVKNDEIEDMFIRVIDKKNSATIFLLYYYYQYDWPNVWLLSSTDITDVIDKIKKERRKGAKNEAL